MKPSTHINDRHDFKDVLMGINPEQQKGEGVGGAHTCSSLDHMITLEQQAVQWEGGVY